MRKRLGRERFGMIVGLPILILLVGGGWVIWRLNADLDDIEARQLEWSLLGTLFWQHLKVTAAAAVAVLVTAIPLGVLLTRPRFRRFSGPVVAVATQTSATAATTSTMRVRSTRTPSAVAMPRSSGGRFACSSRAESVL